MFLRIGIAVFILSELAVLAAVTVYYVESKRQVITFLVFHILSFLLFAGGLNFHWKTGEFPNPGIFFGAAGGFVWLATVGYSGIALVYGIWRRVDHMGTGITRLY